MPIVKLLNPQFGLSELQLETVTLRKFMDMKVFAWKNQSHPVLKGRGYYSKADNATDGIPDISFMWKGVTYYVELKKPAKYIRNAEQLEKLLETSQVLFHHRLRAQGAIVVTLDAVDDVINHFHFVCDSRNDVLIHLAS